MTKITIKKKGYEDETICLLRDNLEEELPQFIEELFCSTPKELYDQIGLNFIGTYSGELTYSYTIDMDTFEITCKDNKGRFVSLDTYKNSRLFYKKACEYKKELDELKNDYYKAIACIDLLRDIVHDKIPSNEFIKHFYGNKV